MASEQDSKLAKMQEEASKLLTKSLQEGTVKQEQVVVAGAITDVVLRSAPLQLLRTHEYAAGKFVIFPPSHIHTGTPGLFVHEGGPISLGPKGSKAGMVYVVPSNDDKELQAYVLAWSVPESPSVAPKNKVYVVAGSGVPKHPLGIVDWGEIERRLDASTNKSNYYDPITRASASAFIDDGNKVVLGATFT